MNIHSTLSNAFATYASAVARFILLSLCLKTLSNIFNLAPSLCHDSSVYMAMTCLAGNSLNLTRSVRWCYISDIDGEFTLFQVRCLVAFFGAPCVSCEDVYMAAVEKRTIKDIFIFTVDIITDDPFQCMGKRYILGGGVNQIHGFVFARWQQSCMLWHAGMDAILVPIYVVNSPHPWTRLV